MQAKSKQDRQDKKDLPKHSRKPFSLATLGAVVLALALGLSTPGPAEASIVHVNLDPDGTLEAGNYTSGNFSYDLYQLFLTPSTYPPVYLIHAKYFLSGDDYRLSTEFGGISFESGGGFFDSGGGLLESDEGEWGVLGYTVEISLDPFGGSPQDVNLVTLLGANELIGMESQSFLTEGYLWLRTFYVYDGIASLDYRVGEFIHDPDPDAKNFIGFQFRDADGVHYGWIEVSMPADASSLTIHAYAYESEVGVPIAAGAATPLPSCLLLLGSGLLGLGLLGRRRQQS